jgi:hypothetical protein
MSPSQWGPPTWMFLHTLAAKVKNESFPIVGKNIIMLIIQICNNLPCPDCAQHSKQFWSKVNLNQINSQKDLINLLYVFHNIVNKRKHNLPFRYEDLQYYNTCQIIETFNSFIRNFNTKGNMNLINESFHRKIMLSSLKGWLMNNLIHFNL